MPKLAAESYADRTFAKVMWIKATAVYIALAAGFDILFQDVDLVWMRDPIAYLHDKLLSQDILSPSEKSTANTDKSPSSSSSAVPLSSYDILFMDDGARTPRFAPYFTNTGFYFVRHNERTNYFMERLLRSYGEILFTASHQATFIRY